MRYAVGTLCSSAALCLGSLFLLSCGGSSASTNNTVQLAVRTAGSGSVTSNPAGIDCGTTCSAGFASGSTVDLSATPAANSYFASWGGACKGAATCRVTLSSNSMVTAKFSSSPTLTVVVGGSGSGSIASDPSGIDCGAACTAAFAPGTKVALAASPASGSTFTGWGGACSGTGSCQVTMQNSGSVTANFTGLPALLVTVKGSGTITSSPAGINCGSSCTAPFQPGTQITLTAMPDAGAFFAGWTGAVRVPQRAPSLSQAPRQLRPRFQALRCSRSQTPATHRAR